MAVLHGGAAPLHPHPQLLQRLLLCFHFQLLEPRSKEGWEKENPSLLEEGCVPNMVCSLWGSIGSQEWCDAHESMGNVVSKQEVRLDGATC